MGPLLLTAGLHVLLMVVYVCAYRGDVSALVCADASQVGRWPYEKIDVGFPASGFDGQYYYVLARDPWRRHDVPVIDLPPYRHARILYPALAWVLSGGDPTRLLWVLPAINLAAIVGLAWLGARLAVHFGRSAWWGVLLPIVLNTGISALRDLTDPLATVTVCGLLAAWILRWPAWQLAAWGVAAVLSREQNFLVLVIVLFEALHARCWTRAGGLAAALLVGVGWLITLKATYGAWPMAPGNLSPPFAGMWYRWTHLEGLSGAASRWIHVAGMLLLSLQVGLSIVLVPVRANRLAVLVASAGAILAILGGTGIYLNGWSYSRVFLWMPLGVWLWSLESGRRWPALLMTAAAIWPLAAVAQAWS
jgi:hypothetical protein